MGGDEDDVDGSGEDVDDRGNYRAKVDTSALSKAPKAKTRGKRVSYAVDGSEDEDSAFQQRELQAARAFARSRRVKGGQRADDNATLGYVDDFQHVQREALLRLKWPSFLLERPTWLHLNGKRKGGGHGLS